MAEAYAIDNNNITMASVNFDIYDLAKMWEPEGYAEIGHHDRMHVSCMTQEEATMEIVIDPLDLSCRLARMTSMH